jgi:hypothetical protein
MTLHQRTILQALARSRKPWNQQGGLSLVQLRKLTDVSDEEFAGLSLKGYVRPKLIDGLEGRTVAESYLWYLTGRGKSVV